MAVIVDELIRHLEYLLEFLKSDSTQRSKRPLLHTSSYYKWLTYTLLRREIFEKIKTYSQHPAVSDKTLIDTWEQLKEWGLDGKIREGVMHECLYWLASLKAQANAPRPFLIAPIHEGIPAIAATSVANDTKLHFRGDFIVLWTKGETSQTAIIDVKADFGSALDDKYLRATAHRYAEMKIPFFLASPSPTIRDFETMRNKQYLLNIEEYWEHRTYPLEYKSGPYPKSQPAPWIADVS